MSERFSGCLESQALLLAGWGDRIVPGSAPYPSNIGDDHSPFEYSLAFEPNGTVELRFLIEAQAPLPSAAANQASALDVSERLLRRYGVFLGRFEAIRQLFIVESPTEFSLWHAVCWKQDGTMEFKVYLNPQARGRERALAVVQSAFERLGLAASGEHVARMIRRGEHDELRYFSLDLSADARARVKVYAAHHHACAADLEAVLAMSPGHRAGDAFEFCAELLGGVGPFARRAVTTCLAFTAGADAPSAATLHLPIAHYLRNDADALEKVSGFLQRHGHDARAYERAFAGMAREPASAGYLTQSYASLRRANDGLRVTAYLSPLLFGG